ALGLATPISVIVGVGKAAEIGLIIRRSEALQRASNITTIVLDKTGTISEGQPKVIDIIASEPFSKDSILTLAASIEKASEHPLAAAIVAAAHKYQLQLSTITQFESITGQGVKGRVNKKTILLGNKQLMATNGIALNTITTQVSTFSEQGQTPLYLAVNDQLAGLICVSDPIREDAIAAIKRLRQLSISVAMLTGDNAETAKAIAEKIGIDTFCANVSPKDKAIYINKLQRQGEVVGMTGDGINDAPALAQADVGFAIGSGTDIAIETADITLLRSSLHSLSDAIELSRATLRNIKQNLLGAFAYNALGIPIAAGILFPFSGILLNPVIAGAAMALSSVTVVTNANRLKLFKPSQELPL
ncbi:MAG: heavy metal translocating P-type ATPase, partial [Endozoicomonas sp. (ex Botrylloides leachii)]|nr:heavy metal translocating P-type ATPase [Endozoicomonas sp. (ex Botrylloides leachii)]